MLFLQYVIICDMNGPKDKRRFWLVVWCDRQLRLHVTDVLTSGSMMGNCHINTPEAAEQRQCACVSGQTSQLVNMTALMFSCRNAFSVSVVIQRVYSASNTPHSFHFHVLRFFKMCISCVITEVLFLIVTVLTLLSTIER